MGRDRHRRGLRPSLTVPEGEADRGESEGDPFNGAGEDDAAPGLDGPTIPGALEDTRDDLLRAHGDGEIDTWEKTQHLDIDRRLLFGEEPEPPERAWGEQTQRELRRVDTRTQQQSAPLIDDPTPPDPSPLGAADTAGPDLEDLDEHGDATEVEVRVGEEGESALSDRPTDAGQRTPEAEPYDAKRALAEALLSLGGGGASEPSEELSLSDISQVSEERWPAGGFAPPDQGGRDSSFDRALDRALAADASERPEPSGIVRLDSAEVADLAIEVSSVDGTAELGQHGGEAADDDSVEAWHGRIMELEDRLLSERGPARISLLFEIGKIWDERLTDPESAAMFYERVLSEAPDHREAFAALARIYEATRSRPALIELMLNRVERAGREEQLQLFHTIAELYQLQGEPSKAVVVLEAALEIAPEHEPTKDALSRLAGAPERAVADGTAETPRDPVAMLEQQLEQTASEDERIEILEQLTSLWQRRGDTERTIDCLERIIELDRRHESAYGRLARIYERAGEHQLLAEVLVRHLNAAHVSRRAELNRRLGQLYEGPLADPRQALSAYRDAFAADPDNRATLQAVVRLSEQLEDWQAAAAALRDLAELSSDAQRVGYLTRLGGIFCDQLGQRDRGEELYFEALELSPSHAEALEQLLAIYGERGDWGKVVRALGEADAHTNSVAQKSRFRFRAAMATLDHLRDRQQATTLFEKTLAVDPDHREAAEKLADLYYADQRFDALEPVLEQLLRRVDRSDTAKVKRLYQRFGRLSEALDKQQRARSYYRKVLELDPKDVTSLRRLAEMTFVAEDWSDALTLSLRLLDVCREGAGATGELDERDVVAVLHMVARSGQRLGDQGRALEALDDILALDPKNVQALERLAEVRHAQGDIEAVVATKRRLLELINDDDECARVRLEIGDALSEAGRPEEAAQAYWQALEPRPQSHTVLHRLLDIYSGSGRWQETVQLCDRLAEAEPDSKKRAKYYHTAAVIFRDELGEAERAIDYFNKVLDADAQMLKAFESIDKLCTERRDWKRLERAYGRMIQRLPEEGATQLKITLWHNLGEVLRSRRRDFETSVAAFEAAQRLDPDNLERKQILAELYVSIGGPRAAEAVAIHHEMLQRWPQRLDLYHTLARLYLDQGQYDPAWCICAALVYLRQADEQELSYYRQYAVLAQASARASDDLWLRRIAHPDADPRLSAVFAILAPAAAALTARPHADFNIKRKARCDLNSEQSFVARMFSYVTSVFGLPLADLHLRPDFEAGLLMAHTVEAPTFVAGAPVLAEGREKEIAFLVGKQLALLRPEYFSRNALAAQSHLQVVLLAAVKLCRKDFMLPPGQEVPVERMLAHIRKHQLHPAALDQLGRLTRDLKLERVDLAAWWRGVELTAERIGLIVCADPYVAAQMIGSECEGNETLAKERIAEMVRFAVSEDYFHVRKELGLAIG